MSDHLKRGAQHHDIALPPVRRGSTVQACPGTPLWHSGARFGHVVATRRLEALVALGRGRRLWVSLNSILEA